MSTTALNGLRDYLYSTLSPSNMIWLGTQLTEYGKKKEEALKSYTKEELIARAERGREEIACDHYVTIDELLRDMDNDYTEDNVAFAAEDLQLETA